jgi:pimeloyl-ACP methyl ester carboxylesterase
MSDGPKTIVLIHGAWHGGWCWHPVLQMLAAHGHRVSAPTLTGLGERAHLLSADVSIDTFVEDVAAHIRFERLHEVVLVGHSFAGTILSALAEQMPDRLSQLIYLDALIVEAGVAPFDQFSPEVQTSRRRKAEETSGGLTLPAPRPEFLGITDEMLGFEILPLLSPHPFRTFTDPAPFFGAVGNGLDCAYVRCVDPVYAPLEGSRIWAEKAGWPIHDLQSGHDCMLISPDETSDLIHQLATGEH